MTQPIRPGVPIGPMRPPAPAGDAGHVQGGIPTEALQPGGNLERFILDVMARSPQGKRLRTVGMRRIIDIQTQLGQNVGYRAISGTANFTRDAAGTLPLALTLTPDVDCWWDVHANIGILQKTDAAYHYAYGQLTLSPADVDGVTSGPQILTQHSTVDDYGWRSPRRIFKLKKGTTYTCTALFSSSGGTWQFYQGGDYLYIEGIAYTRPT